MDGVLALALFGLWVFCVVDVLFTPADRCRGLPKLAWLAIVVLLSWLGSAVWLLAGRPRRTVAVVMSADADKGPSQAPRDALGWSSVDDADFLEQCRDRAEEQRARYRRSQRDDEA